VPTALIVPNAAQMRLIWALGGQLYALNVMGVVAGAIAINQTLANTLGTAIKSGFTSSAFVAAVHPTVTLVNIGIRDIRTASQPEFLDTGASVAGTGTGDLLPPQTALCITLRTASAGARFRGRVYLPGYTEGNNTATGTLSAAGSSVSFVTAIQSALIASSLNLGVIHRPTAAPLPVTSGFITTVTSIVARDLVWDTQRRRAVPGI
jgi:hypothetical protein